MRLFIQTVLGKFGLRLLDLRKFGRDPWRDVKTLLHDTPAPICFDIGAHRGETVMNMLGHLPNAAIHAFEPDPDNFAALQAVTKDLPQVKVYPLAMDDHAYQSKLQRSRLSQCNSLLTPAEDLKSEAHEKIGEVEVNITSLDQFCQENGIASIDLLKTDCQGLDLRVLRGAATLLKEGRVNLVQCESIFHSEYAGQCWFYEILEFLTKAGYAPVCFCDPTRNEHHEIMYADVIFKRRATRR